MIESMVIDSEISRKVSEISAMTRRVLIVDDEALIRWSVAESLEAAGFVTSGAASAAEAIARLGEDAFAVVLLDLRLPDSSDLGLLRRIRQLAPAARVILMTAYGTPEVLAEARQLGAMQTLSKPFDMTRIVGLVREAAV
jgi:two-component system response regulator AtoC